MAWAEGIYLSRAMPQGTRAMARSYEYLVSEYFLKVE